MENSILNTSKTAFERVKNVIPIHESIIYKVLLNYGNMTSLEISERCKLSYHQVARRLAKMQRDNRVSAFDKKLYKGSKRTVWGCYES